MNDKNKTAQLQLMATFLPLVAENMYVYGALVEISKSVHMCALILAVLLAALPHEPP